MENILSKIIELRDSINKYNEIYYGTGESPISDYEYDKMMSELRTLEEKYPHYKDINSPTQKVGFSSTLTKFQKVKHSHPMLSLDNSYSEDEVINFMNRVSKKVGINTKIRYCLEVKLDGLSISLIYEHGKLKRAVTRGDGIVGEDVTENILQIDSVPKHLNKDVTIEVRGEVVLRIDNFIKLNESRIKNNEEPFANPRNAASGTLRQLDANVVKERGLDVYIYYIHDKDNKVNSHMSNMLYLKTLGFKTTNIFELVTSENVRSRIDYWEKERRNLPYETDGLVIKVDNIDLYDILGSTSKTPRWAIAYKFPATRVSTKLLDVTWQVGRTGKLTPVAELEEVELSGSKIKRASLHNIEDIQRKDIRIGDRVFIEKAAEIIPQVVKPILDFRNGSEVVIKEPTNCPVCNTKLVRDEGLVDIRCVNDSCPARIQGIIEYAVSRDGLNIIGLGPRLIEKFISMEYIKNISDIYNLYKHKSEISHLEKMGDKSVDKLMSAIEDSKSIEYDKVICSLGIPFVGKSMSKILANYSKNIDVLINMSLEELSSIDGVGQIAAYEIHKFFSENKNKELISELKAQGLNFVSKEQNIENKLHGKTFLVTGSLKHFTRESIQEEIEKMGGKNLNSVSKNLNYLIVGDNVGSKLEKARNIESIKIITEDDFIKMIK